MAITIQQPNELDDNDMESLRKRKKKNRREIDKEFFIPYQPSDFKREKGLKKKRVEFFYIQIDLFIFFFNFIYMQTGNSII